MTSAVSFNEACDRLAVSRRTLKRWGEAGIIRLIQPIEGGRIVVPISEIERILNGGS